MSAEEPPRRRRGVQIQSFTLHQSNLYKLQSRILHHKSFLSEVPNSGGGTPSGLLSPQRVLSPGVSGDEVKTHLNCTLNMTRACEAGCERILLLGVLIQLVKCHLSLFKRPLLTLKYCVKQIYSPKSRLSDSEEPKKRSRSKTPSRRNKSKSPARKMSQGTSQSLFYDTNECLIPSQFWPRG